MNVSELLQKAYAWGPLLFGIQSMDAASLAAPAGMTNLQFGLVVGVITGSVAKMRGRWI
jgi:uncharacterized membrane protein YdjX (TVP38/TMEM64 family)